MWHVTRDIWHVTRDMRHVTSDMLWGVNILSKFPLPRSSGLWFMIFWRFRGKGWFSDWIKLRFILPCKSDCQPIFLKKQGIYSLYAKLWLFRPLIKNIPDSSQQYGSNVTFGASLAFQMREEYIFEKKDFLKIGPQGGEIVALRNFTRNLRIFLDSSEIWIENKKNSLGKNVLKIWSQICGKISMLVHKVTMKLKCKKVKTHKT